MRTIKFTWVDDTILLPKVVGKLKVEDRAYGWDITDPEISEWELTIRITMRQDGATAWFVALTMVDGDVKILQDLSSTVTLDHRLEAAVSYLTERWIDPINPKVM